MRFSTAVFLVTIGLLVSCGTDRKLTVNTAPASAPPSLAFEQASAPTTEVTPDSTTTTTTSTAPSTTTTTTAASSTTTAAPTTTTAADAAEVWIIGVDVQAGQATVDLFAANVFEVASMPTADVPENAIFDLARIQGQMAVEDLPAGSILTEGSFAVPVFALPDDQVVYEATAAIPRGTPLDHAFDEKLVVLRDASVVDSVPEDAARDIVAALNGDRSPVATIDIEVGTVIVVGHFEKHLPQHALEIAYFELQELPDLPPSANGTSDGLFVHFDLAGADTNAETAATSIVVPALTDIGFRLVQEGRASLMVYGTCGFAEIVQAETDRVEVSFIDGC